MSALELQELVKHYTIGPEIVRAVDGVSLTVAPGELAALYGPSGSGKTTLLLLTAGLLAADSGRVLFDGRDVTRSGPGGSPLPSQGGGFCVQSFHLLPGASALDNAALKLLGDGWTLRDARRVTRPWLERMGLGGRTEHTPDKLSMGERQRVAIARALAGGPRLLLTDEPTGNLDSKRSREILALLRDICHEQDIPGLLVTHDPQATAFVDCVHTLRDGHLAEGLDAELATNLSS